MSNVRLFDLLSNGDNESTKEMIGTFSTNEEAFSKMSYDNGSKIPSLSLNKNPIWMSGSRKLPLDIDVGYAIELLKKEDQNTNVYSHLQGIIDKILSERPENPLESFELYSQKLKRLYIPTEGNYFEPVFVDSVNRDDCRKSLQMYKCALKTQSEKRKRYTKNNASAKKSDVSRSDDKKTINDSNDIEVRVQNLWEVNYMFDKAGCGLPMDEIALISITMNTMARLNQFKSIRFWGKIFGMKNTYFILECEWTDVELHRKILMSKNNSESSSLLFKKGSSNVVTDSYLDKQQFVQLSELDYSSDKNKNETESKKSSQHVSFTPTVKTINSDVSDELIISNDSWTSVNVSDNVETKMESSSSKTPDEIFGTGTNKYVYFVTNDLNTKWIELDSVRKQNIDEARKIKRYFTGKLYEPVDSFPKFKGLEIDYLRAQIARITASTQICPQGYYIMDRREIIIPTKALDNQPSVSFDPTKISKDNDTITIARLAISVHVDLIQNENVEPIPNNDLIRTDNWVHKNPRIQYGGIANKSELPVPYRSMINEEWSFAEDEEYINYTKNSLNHSEALFGNLQNDISIDTTPAWKGGLCSPFDSRNSCAMMRSLVWPGAHAVVHKLETDYVYIGWAQKNDSIGYSSNLISELRMGNLANANLLVYQEHMDGQKPTNPKKNVFTNKKYRKVYKGGEKILKNYTYS